MRTQALLQGYPSTAPAPPSHTPHSTNTKLNFIHWETKQNKTKQTGFSPLIPPFFFFPLPPYGSPCLLFLQPHFELLNIYNLGASINLSTLFQGRKQK